MQDLHLKKSMLSRHFVLTYSKFQFPSEAAYFSIILQAKRDTESRFSGTSGYPLRLHRHPYRPVSRKLVLSPLSLSDVSGVDHIKKRAAYGCGPLVRLCLRCYFERLRVMPRATRPRPSRVSTPGSGTLTRKSCSSTP